MIKKITIKSDYFANETELELFKNNAISVVYGRNGSGKSTIARGIRSLAAENVDDEAADITVSSQPAIPKGLTKSVFVFDEEFVDKQLKVAKDGIDTIVMLGEQVGLEEQILKAMLELAQFEQEKRAFEAEKERLEDVENEISPKYYLNIIRKGLTETGGWFDIYKGLKGGNESYVVTESQARKLLKLDEPEATYDELRLQLKEDLNLYYNSTNARVVEWHAAPLKLSLSLKKVEDLLAAPLDKPELSERELRLMSLITTISQHPQHFSKKNTREMLREQWEFCPLCLREIGGADRNNIARTLKHMLSRDSSIFEKKLGKLANEFAPREINIPEFPNFLYENEVYRAKMALEEVNRVIALVRKKIESRQRNIYEAIDNPFTYEEKVAYGDALSNWKIAIGNYRRCVRSFNKSVKNRQGLLNRITNENNLLARKQFSPVIQSYQQAELRMLKNLQELKAIQGKIDIRKYRMNELQQKKERTDIALDYINQELQYVFYGDKKMELEQGKGCYILKVNGKSVKPNKISVGERNALALCYFFASLDAGKRETEKYKTESLVVIDDPVSSFDHGNRVGVMSLLRYQFYKIVDGNANSRILVMSHDLHTVFDLVKIRSDIQGGRGGEKKFLELENKQLKEQDVRNEYKKLLEQVYAYAADDREKEYDDVMEMSIGNIMRRMMEAFSSFCYNEPFEKMAREENVLALIPKEKRGYYENLMWRLVLNSESHTEEGAYSLDLMVENYTRKEKLKTAKSLLLFLYYINKVHLVAYLKEKNEKVDKIKKIEGWMTEEL